GTLLHRLDIGGTQWNHGRYFQAKEGWFVLTLALGRPSLEPLSIPSYAKAAPLKVVFDRKGYEFPWAVDFHGGIHYLNDEEPKTLKTGFGSRVERVSMDGEHILFKSGRGNEAYQMTTGNVEFAIRDNCYYRELMGTGSTMRNAMHRFNRVGLNRMGDLGLTKGQVVWVLYIDEIKNRLGLKKQAMDQFGPAAFKNFLRCATPGAGRYKLNVARFDDGLAVFLDARGLLHLKSPDRTLHEVTIALSDQGLGAWCSDGTFHGEAYYLDEEPSLPARDFYEKIQSLTQTVHSSYAV
ncbi:MAG: hypothetical protein AAF492_12260, partial [Verrucomicrobiota bacterium]